MRAENGKFYFIKDDFFELFKGYKLMKTKKMVIKGLVIFVLVTQKMMK